MVSLKPKPKTLCGGLGVQACKVSKRLGVFSGSQPRRYERMLLFDCYGSYQGVGPIGLGLL